MSAQGNYFQQRVDYRIEVELDDEAHRISGIEKIVYTNNSPDTLDYLIFHLWGNAFGDRNSAFSRQQLRLGHSNFYYAPEEELGGYEQIRFFASAYPVSDSRQELSFSSWQGEPDIVKVELAHTLLPGEEVHLEIEFEEKIPKTVSRFGHSGQSYQMSQWYPKPAVYDKEGWHPMPYLDMGEFYSEFGSFEVFITLPANYRVAATGELQNEEEKAWLAGLVGETRLLLKTDSAVVNATEDPFPPSSPEKKTLHYKAENVHDFAWFADKRYLVDSSHAVLPSGKKIPTWAFFRKTHLDPWDQAAFFVARALEYYSDRVGEYPWPQATAVSGPMGAGGGMEYPMVTIISSWNGAKGLDAVITHEVGHNWFYGIFGTNERRRAWMDEGCNSYYDHSYMREYYESEDSQLRFLLEDSLVSVSEVLYDLQRRRNYHQAPDTHSDSLSMINYLLSAYEFPAHLFRYLEHYLGRGVFDRAMHDYFAEWKFKHPYPEDMQASLERSTGKDLSWFFDGFLEGTPRMDYKLVKMEKLDSTDAAAHAPPAVDVYRAVIENRGDVAAPYPLFMMQGDSTLLALWRDGTLETDTVLCLIPRGTAQPSHLVIDPLHLTPDLYRKDNQLQFDKAGRGRPFHFRLLSGIDKEEHRDLYYLPLLAWNDYDKFMLGAGLHNYALAEKPVEFGVLALYSFVTKQLNGMASLQVNYHPKREKNLRAFRYGLNFRHFTYNYNWTWNYYTDYYRLEPYLRWEFKKELGSRKSSYVQYRMPTILEEYGYFGEGPDYELVETRYRPKLYHELRYGLRNDALLMPFEGDVALEYHAYDVPLGGDEPERWSYVRLSANWVQRYEYDVKRRIKLRVFLGWFLQNDARNRGGIYPGAFNLTGQGYSDHDDYKYDGLYLGRNNNGEFWARQIDIRDGGFKNAFSRPYLGEAGNSNDFMLSFNFEASLPQPAPRAFPLKPYFDLAYVSDARPIAAGKTFADQLWWSGGFVFKIGEDFGVYLPVLSSENLVSLYKQDGKSSFFSRITFSFKTDLMKPQNLRSLLDRLNF